MLIIWAGELTSDSRVTNGPEFFHSSLNKVFHHSHPSVHVVIVALQNIQNSMHLAVHKKYSARQAVEADARNGSKNRMTGILE